MTIRVGIGYDIHRLKTSGFATRREGKGVHLGGVLIPCDQELIGHSDGDVLTHAICDALLGAVGAGDMGAHFPDTDERFRGKESFWFLKEVAKKVQKKGFKISQIDSVVIAERPRLSEYRRRIQKKLASLLRISIGQVSIKAKTNEGLDSVGGKKAIAAWAVSLVEKVKIK